MSEVECPETEAPSCVLKSLPSDMLVAAADHAAEVNPVNRPMLAHALLASTALADPPLFLALLTTKYWGPTPRVLSVSFLDGTGVALGNLILSCMNEWSKSGCIKFKRTQGTGEVRISRAGSGYWSYLGTDILMVPTDQPTMNLQGFTTRTPVAEFLRVVPHETGHCLGFPHEHERAEFVQRIDPARAVAYFNRTYGWPAAMTESNVLTSLDQRTLMGTPPDQDSIMAYQLPGAIMRDGIPVRGGARINASDFAFNAKVYPKVSRNVA